MKFPLRWHSLAVASLSCAAIAWVGCQAAGGTDEGAQGGAGGAGGVDTSAGGAAGTAGSFSPGGQGGDAVAGAGGQSGGGGQAGMSQAGGGAAGGSGGTAGGGGAAGAIAPPPIGPGAVASAACASAQGSPDGEHMVVVNGKPRAFLVRVPRAYDGKHPYRAIFMFHGAGSSSIEFDRAWWFRQDIGEFVVLILPQALYVNDNKAMTTWSRDIPDDIAFFDAMLAYVKPRLCFDTTRVFSGGLSSGGNFSNTLGCQRGDVLRGIAPVSGGRPGSVSNCKGNVAAWIANGKNDPLVKPSDGMAARDFWLNRNACSSANPMATGDATNCVAYNDCKAGFPVQWCLHDGTHFWPRSANLGLWNFFSKL